MNTPLNSRAFRAAREADWRRLDALVTLAERKSPAALSDADLMALPVLYRSTLSSLSVARDTSLDAELIAWLESLCARAYFFLYGVRTHPARRVADFLVRDWPAATASLWRECLASAALLFIGVAAGWLLVSSDPAFYSAFVPDGLANGRTPSATTEALRATLYDGEGKSGLAIFATFLFTHNSQVAIFAFALGFAFGIPTALLALHNGATLGAFLALFASRDLGFELGGWLIIHGTTEFLAIIIAAAAGFRIGWAILFPGEASRMDAAADAGRTAAKAMVGVVLMLAVAGLLEGFGRQLVTQDHARYAIGVSMLLLWLGFFFAARGMRPDG